MGSLILFPSPDFGARLAKACASPGLPMKIWMALGSTAKFWRCEGAQFMHACLPSNAGLCICCCTIRDAMAARALACVFVCVRARVHACVRDMRSCKSVYAHNFLCNRRPISMIWSMTNSQRTPSIWRYFQRTMSSLPWRIVSTR